MEEREVLHWQVDVIYSHNVHIYCSFPIHLTMWIAAAIHIVPHFQCLFYTNNMNCIYHHAVRTTRKYIDCSKVYRSVYSWPYWPRSAKPAKSPQYCNARHWLRDGLTSNTLANAASTLKDISIPTSTWSASLNLGWVAENTHRRWLSEEYQICTQSSLSHCKFDLPFKLPSIHAASI